MATNRRNRWGGNPYCPSQEDIRRACEEIQESWSEHESQRRAGVTPKSTWLPPVITIDGGMLNEEEAA